MQSAGRVGQREVRRLQRAQRRRAVARALREHPRVAPVVVDRGLTEVAPERGQVDAPAVDELSFAPRGAGRRL